MTRACLGRRYHFVAAHRLHTPALSDEANRQAYGKCNNPHGHGHNYTVEVIFTGPIDPRTGMVTNLSDLDTFARQYLLDPMDHANLNCLPLFANLVPTTENLAVELHRIFAQYPHATLLNLHIEETPNNSFDYAAP